MDLLCFHNLLPSDLKCRTYTISIETETTHEHLTVIKELGWAVADERYNQCHSYQLIVIFSVLWITAIILICVMCFFFFFSKFGDVQAGHGVKLWIVCTHQFINKYCLCITLASQLLGIKACLIDVWSCPAEVFGQPNLTDQTSVKWTVLWLGRLGKPKYGRNPSLISFFVNDQIFGSINIFYYNMLTT
jgi:hypothetical protein